MAQADPCPSLPKHTISSLIGLAALTVVMIAAGVVGMILARPVIAPQLGGLAYGLLVAAGGLAGLMMAANVAVLVLALASLMESQTHLEANNTTLEHLESSMQHQNQDLHQIATLGCLSDRAKSLLYRERELDAIREMIHAMLLQQDTASAEALLETLEKDHGMVDEAARLREEIDNAQKATLQEKIDAAIGRIRGLLDRRQWQQAQREAGRMMKLFPERDDVKSLPQKIRATWNEYKGSLLREYSQAVKVNDVERSIELLKELDHYLTPEEGAALAESARDVFKKKLHNLGVQFAIAVADLQWQNAIATGEEIIREYPNSRMAREVRSKLDLLRDYASGAKQPPAVQATQMVDQLPDQTPGK